MGAGRAGYGVAVQLQPGRARASGRRGPGQVLTGHPRAGAAGPGRDRGQRAVDIMSLGSFVALGLPDGMLGTAWPALRRSFHVPVGDLGLVLVLVTVGSVTVSAFVGRLVRRFGVGALLATGGASAAIGAAGFVLAPGFWLVLGIAALFGVAAGITDGGLNTAVGMSGRRRLLNLMHGCYGVGTSIGPLVVTLAVLTVSWRAAYAFLLVSDLTLAALWLRRRDAFGHGAAPADGAGPAAGANPAAPRAGDGASVGHGAPAYRGAVTAGLVIFFVYTGLEVAAGQWETTFNQGHLRLGPSSAGLATFGYWAALTLVRVSLALVPRPPSSQAVVRWGGVTGLAATAVIWWQPGKVTTILAFVVLGGALAGIFPALVALTPARVGDHLAQHVIAWQVGAAAAGGAALSALVGLLVGADGLGVLGPSLTAMAVLMLVAMVAQDRVSPVHLSP